MKQFLIIITVFLTVISAPVFASQTLLYRPGLIQEALDNGEIVFVDYFANWCPTCKSQARVLAKLRNENPKYDEVLTFVKVNWDSYKNHEVATSRNITYQSSFILLKGDEELGRLIAQTSEEEIKNFLDLALASAS